MPARNVTLADGQLGASAATLLSGADFDGNVQLACHNTAAAKQTVVINFQRAGGTARRIARAVLEQDESLFVTGIALQPDDTLLGYATGASAVDYMVTLSAGPFSIYTRAATGAPKAAPGLSVTLPVQGIDEGTLVVIGLLEEVRDLLAKIA